MFDDYFYDAIWVADYPIDVGPAPVALADDPTPLPWEAEPDPVPWEEAPLLAGIAHDHLAEAMEAPDRPGNHEIQRLMQMMNQADTLESQVREKMQDTENSIIGKI